MLNRKNYLLIVASSLILTSLLGCKVEVSSDDDEKQETATEFVDRVNKELIPMNEEGAKVAWVAQTYITDDTQELEALSSEKFLAYNSEIIEQTKDLDLTGADAKTLRAINIIKTGSTLPAPNDAEKRAELATIMSGLGATYGKGKYCPDGEASCKSLGELSNVLVTSRDYDEQLEAWKGWRTISPAMKKDYARFVELSNEGAQELGLKIPVISGKVATI